MTKNDFYDAEIESVYDKEGNPAYPEFFPEDKIEEIKEEKMENQEAMLGNMKAAGEKEEAEESNNNLALLNSMRGDNGAETN